VSLPHPNTIRRRTQEIRALLDDKDPNGIPKLFRSGYHAAYDKLKNDEVKVKTARSSPDPTGSNAVDRQAQARRKKLAQGELLLESGLAAIRGAHRLFSEALPDNRSIQETAPEKDSAVGPGYVKEMKAYQQKRKNAEWDGESAEVV
jgi:hypothetical protein